jgi:hypothetical protein
MVRALFLAVLASALLAAASAAAGVHMFAYDAANDATRRVSGDLTFRFDQRVLFTRVYDIRSTEGRASADLRPADEHALGPGGLTRLIGTDAHERDLYQVEPSAEGTALVHAFCPGSARAWLAFGRLAEGAPLRVRVLGDSPAGGPAHLCQTLDFAYRGEWRLPPGQGVPAGALLSPHFPY